MTDSVQAALNVYISIGNSDDKLTQLRWSDYVADVEQRLAESGFKMHGSWFSRPDAVWQNACWCVEPGVFNSPAFIDGFKEELRRVAERYNQDSIVWAEAEPEFLTGASHD